MVNKPLNTELFKSSKKKEDGHDFLQKKKIYDGVVRQNLCQYKVLIYLDCLQGYGADKVLIKLANGLADKGIRVSLITAKKEKTLNLKIRNSININHLNSSRFNPIKNIVRLKHYINRYDPDIVLSSIHFNNLVASYALALAGKKSKLILRQANVLKEQFKDYPLLVSLPLYHLLKLAYKNADLLIAPSQAVTFDMQKYLGVESKKIQRIYNPTVTSDIFEKATKNPNHEWFQKKYPIILSVGRLKPQKDFKTLLKAFAKVKPKFKQVKLVILGEGPQRKKLESLAIKLKIEKDVDLVGYEKNPYPFISKADLFVSSSRYEGLPNVLIEALALDQKIVATDCIGGSAEILRYGLYGELVPINNENLMAKAIERALKNESLVLKKAKSKDRFNHTEQINKYIVAIEKLVVV